MTLGRRRNRQDWRTQFLHRSAIRVQTDWPARAISASKQPHSAFIALVSMELMKADINFSYDSKLFSE